MITIKAKHWTEVPDNYTGIIEWENGDKWWYKNEKWHREDGPAIIWENDDKAWYLDNKMIWSSRWNKLNLKNKIILSKGIHPEYPTVQIWKYIDQNGIQEQVINPGMKEYITE